MTLAQSSGDTKKITLKDFIDENHKLLTVMGVLFALVGLFSRYDDELAKMVSFTIYLMAILLFVEVWIAFPRSEQASTRMSIFEFLYFLAMANLTLWVAYGYREQIVRFSPLLQPVVFTLLFVMYAFVATRLVKKRKVYEYVRKKSPEGKRYSQVLRGLVFIIIFAIIIAATYFSYRGILEILKYIMV